MSDYPDRPWAMMAAEFQRALGHKVEPANKRSKKWWDWKDNAMVHRNQIELAMAAGRPIPAAVLAEYRLWVAPPQLRLPWQMTAVEYRRTAEEKYVKKMADQGKEASGNVCYSQSIAAGERHRKVVSRAVLSGKPVPPEVLADYPDLSKAEGRPK